MLSVVLPIIGILGLWLFSGQKVNATPATAVYVLEKKLDSTKNYTVDGMTAVPDPGEGNRAAGYALFDAANGILTLHNLDITLVDTWDGIQCDDDLKIVLEGDSVIHGGTAVQQYGGAGISCGGNITFEEKGNGSIIVESKEDTDPTSGVSVAIGSGGNITINSGTIHAKSGRAYNNNVGIETAMGTITINGGYVEAECVYVNDNCTAVLASNIVLNGCSITSPVGGKIYSHNPGSFAFIVDKNDESVDHVIIEQDDIAGTETASSGKACNHDYQWTVEREPTITEDGEEVYKCTKCGDISARQPLSAAGFCFLDAEGKVRNAKAGQTLKLNFKQWNSVPKAFFEELAKRRDITVVIRFTYNHKTYEMTVTPDMAIDISHDYYGPEKLILLYGAKEVKG